VAMVTSLINSARGARFSALVFMCGTISGLRQG
jgi:hypothetical protein